MSVLVIATMKGDRSEFERVHKERADDFRSVMADAKSAGAIHHQFAFGDDGTITIIDEWKSAEAFQKFFDNATIGSLMQDAKIAAPPEVKILDTFESVDQF